MMAKHAGGRPPKWPEGSEQVAFRFPRDLIDRIDAHALRLQARTPGVMYTRADAARALLHRALDLEEQGAAVDSMALELRNLSPIPPPRARRTSRKRKS